MCISLLSAGTGTELGLQIEVMGCGAVLTPRLASLLADALDIPTAQLRILPVSDDITSRLRDWASVSVCRWPSHCRSISNYVAVALTDETA